MPMEMEVGGKETVKLNSEKKKQSLPVKTPSVTFPEGLIAMTFGEFEVEKKTSKNANKAFGSPAFSS